MKINKFFLGLVSAAMMFASCGNEDLELSDSTTAPVDPSVASFEFAPSNATSFEVDPAEPSFELTVQRKATDAASYNIVVDNNPDNSFVVPASINFAQGETKKALKISMAPNAKQGEPIALTLSVEPKDANPYTKGLKTFTTNVTVIKWENIGVGYWCGNIINTFFGVDGGIPMYVEIEKATTATATKFRFDSPYANIATAKDENGAYNAYPYNTPGYLDGNKEQFIITVTKAGASLAPVNLGIDYGYGSMSIGQFYPNLSENIASYPLGKFVKSATGGYIEFPKNSLYIGDDSDVAPCSAGPSYLYLSAADFIAATEE